MAKKNSSKNKARELPEYDSEFESEEAAEQPRARYEITMAYILNQDDVNGLIRASTEAYIEPITGQSRGDNYTTYTLEEVDALINGVFHPRKSKKKLSAKS